MFSEYICKWFRVIEIMTTYSALVDRVEPSSIKDGLKIGAFLFKKSISQKNHRGTDRRQIRSVCLRRIDSTLQHTHPKTTDLSRHAREVVEDSSCGAVAGIFGCEGYEACARLRVPVNRSELRIVMR